MQPIVFEKSPMTLAEFESINKKFGRIFYRMIFSPGFVVLLVVMVFLVTTLETPFGLFDTLQFLAIFTLVVGVALGLIKYLIDRGLKNMYHENPELAEGFTYTLTEESIIIEGKSTNRTQLELKSFEQATLVNNWLVLSSDNSRYYLDFEQLVPPATVIVVGELLKRKGIVIA